jgi:glycosyltransferase involved in cell wall biosynthesis
LTALAALARDGVPFKMIIAGDGPIRPLLERRIHELGLDDRVELTGWVSNAQVRSLMLKARVIVMPSFAEGLPVVLMEALALGRPVITTYVAGIPELVTDRICGWLVPAGSSGALATAIRECLDAPDSLVLAMGQTGRNRVLDRHDITHECRKLVDLFTAEHTRREQGSRPDEQRTAEDIVADERVTPTFGAVGRSGEQTVLSVSKSQHGQTWITRH